MFRSTPAAATTKRAAFRAAPRPAKTLKKPVIPASAGIQVRTLLDLRPRERSRRWGESCAQKYFFPYPRTVSGFKTVTLHNPGKARFREPV